MRRLGAILILAAGAGAAAVAAQDAAPRLVAREVYLMGTRASLATYAATREEGLATLESALQLLERTEGELSTWRDDSDLSSLNRHPVGTAWRASPDLCRMFAEVFRWHHATGGAFDPAIGRLIAAWKIHDGGAVPSDDALAGARSLSGLGLLSFDRKGCTVTRTANVTVDAGAFGKGEALDRVDLALGDEPWMIDLGGQVAVGGDPHPDGAWTIAIAHPLERDRAYLRVRMLEGSLSTSAGSERDVVVDGRRLGHILDPGTGQPAPFTGSVTVWHRRGLAADALSTALFVMGPEKGLRWAEDHGIAACFLIPERDAVRTESTSAFQSCSDGFRAGCLSSYLRSSAQDVVVDGRQLDG